ncbi:MAG TPA: universal stress protein [Candidatus Binatia bacterium]
MTMYTRLLIPLDGSDTAETVLPYGRTLARSLEIPVELLGIVDTSVLDNQVFRDTGDSKTIIAQSIRSSEEYLKRIAKTFPADNVRCVVETGKPEDVIIEKAGSDATLTAMATHGRSGINRLLMGSVAEKVLRSAINPLILIRASEEANSEGLAVLKSVIVPLDGSELAETVLSPVVQLANALKLEVILLRAYQVPMNTYAGMEDSYPIDYAKIGGALKDEAQSYLEGKVAELKRNGIEKLSFVISDGSGAGEIIALGRQTPDNLIAMCTHGRSGIKRWVLGSVTEKVVRLCGDPVLIVRAG